jgi:RES domain-containing protein
MANYFRIIQRRLASNPLGYGTGGARWNPRGVPLIYAGSNVSIITTEFLSIKGSAVVAAEWSLVTMSIAGGPPQLDIKLLPKDWDARPFPLSTQEFGRQWTRTKSSVCLKVPSARIPLKAYPSEHNLLIDPLHPSLSKEISVTSVDNMFFNLNEWADGTR